MTHTEQKHFEKMLAMANLLGQALATIMTAEINIKYISEKEDRYKLSDEMKKKYDHIYNQFLEINK